MTAIGYARVSTTDQDLTVQIEALKAAGCDVIRKEKASGTSTKGRTELATILDFIREGDTLVVTRIDRLARSIADLQDIVRTLKARGAALRATEQPINTATAAGKCFLDSSACSLNSRRTFAASAEGRGRLQGPQADDQRCRDQEAQERWSRSDRDREAARDRAGVSVSGARVTLVLPVPANRAEKAARADSAGQPTRGKTSCPTPDSLFAKIAPAAFPETASRPLAARNAALASSRLDESQPHHLRLRTSREGAEKAGLLSDRFA